MIKKAIKQIQKLAGKKGTKINYNKYNNTITVTFYPTLFATASEMADFFQANIDHVGGYKDVFRVDKIRTREHELVTCVELSVPEHIRQ